MQVDFHLKDLHFGKIWITEFKFLNVVFFFSFLSFVPCSVIPWISALGVHVFVMEIPVTPDPRYVYFPSNATICWSSPSWQSVAYAIDISSFSSSEQE